MGPEYNEFCYFEHLPSKSDFSSGYILLTSMLKKFDLNKYR